MDLWLEKEFKHYKINIEYCDMVDTRGFITKTPHGPVMFLQNGLPEAMENEVALHELGHYLLQRDETALYKATVAARTQMESEINRSVINEQLISYTANNDLEPDQVNYANFMQLFRIPDYYTDYVKATLAGMQE